jgi:alkanesulfonate monooxygenase SsuD/methylene tetrahydromethanopterin reductase-like flavin-dependent oxidoreductase (luciferase family)
MCGQAKFGLRLPTFPVDGSDGRVFVEQVLSFLGKVEKSFDSVWVDDHFVPWADPLGKTTPTLESFTSISYLSGIFPNLVFGNIVLCNSYRNPALLAKMGATLQALTKGRFVLGIGAGWKEDEYRAYGYEFPPPKVRIRQLEEGVQIIRKMWTEKETTFKGKYFKVDSAYCYPKPDPIPPIMIGGGGEQLTLKVVARHADWWNYALVSPEAYRSKLKVLEEHCRKQGRDYSEIVKTLANMVAIAETEEKARDIASKSPFIRKGNEENYIIGSPDTIIEKLAEYTKLGIEHFMLRFVDFPQSEGAQLFAEKVIPACSSIR